MDEVSGRGAASFAFQFDRHGNIIQCDVCAESGKVGCAAGFCQKCAHFLCKSCIGQHNNLRSSESHEIIEGKNIPTILSDTPDVEKCDVHSDRPVEAYCADHNTFGCSLCLLADHRSCQKIALLSDLSRGVESSKEFQDVQKAADRYKTLEDGYKQTITKYLSMNDEYYTKTLEGFQQFRSEILSFVEEIGEKVHKEAGKLKEDNVRQLKALAEQIEKCSEEVKECMVKIDNRIDHNNHEQLFIALKKNGWNVVECVRRMEKLNKDVFMKIFSFYYDPNFKESLIITSSVNVETTQFPNVMCTCDVDNDNNTNNQTSPAITCTSASEVNIKSPEDKGVCMVMCMMELSATQLILTDFSNRCLKILDTTSNTIIKRRVLKGTPMDITGVSGNRLAVLFNSLKQIMFFTADQNLDPCGSMSVPGDCCYGLQSAEDRLIVSYISPARVQILDLNGTVLKTIQHDPSGNELFMKPYYMTFSHTNQLIYVSDFSKNSLTCMTVTGDVQWVYQDQDLKDPRAVVTGDGGCVYIGCSKNHTVHVVSPSGVRLALIPQSQSGVSDPRALCYSSQHQTLYVSSRASADCNFIRRLSLK